MGIEELIAVVDCWNRLKIELCIQDTHFARARAAVEGAKIPYKVLDDNVETTTGKGSIITMHLANGLEFRTVVLMACVDEIIPLQERIETVADDGDIEEVYNTERHLLYVACTAHGIICW